MSKWEWKKLGDVAEIARGGSPRPIKEFITTEDNGINWIKIGDTDPTGKYIFETEEKIKPSGMKRSRYVEKGDFLLSNSMSFGRPYILMTDGCIHDGWLVLRKYQKLLDIDFFYHLLTSPFVQDQFEREARGSTVRNLNTDIVSKIFIPIPPLAEQKRIVKTLDEKFFKIDKLKTAAETNLKNARELFNAELEKTFNEKDFWKTARLGEIALEYGRGKSKHRPRNDKCLFGGEYPFIQTGDIRNSEKYIERYSETYNEIGLAQSKLWPKGTLCITIAANIAETAILTFPCCFPDSVIGFVPNEQYTSVDFIYYVIQYFKTELQKISKGAAQDNLNLTKLESMDFPLPPLSEQKRIVAHLDKLSEKVKRLEEIYRRTIADCEELKKSILKKTFEGES